MLQLGHVATFNKALTTAETPSTHFVVTRLGKHFRHFEMEWNGHDRERRWREIDQECCQKETPNVRMNATGGERFRDT